jgi:hypothetical protein
VVKGNFEAGQKPVCDRNALKDEVQNKMQEAFKTATEQKEIRPGQLSAMDPLQPLLDMQKQLMRETIKETIKMQTEDTFKKALLDPEIIRRRPT